MAIYEAKWNHGGNRLYVCMSRHLAIDTQHDICSNFIVVITGFNCSRYISLQFGQRKAGETRAFTFVDIVIPRTYDTWIKILFMFIHAIATPVLPLKMRHKRHALFLVDVTFTVCIIVVWVGEDFRVGPSNQVCCPVCVITHSVHYGDASSYEKVSQLCDHSCDALYFRPRNGEMNLSAMTVSFLSRRLARFYHQ